MKENFNTLNNYSREKEKRVLIINFFEINLYESPVTVNNQVFWIHICSCKVQASKCKLWLSRVFKIREQLCRAFNSHAFDWDSNLTNRQPHLRTQVLILNNIIYSGRPKVMVFQCIFVTSKTRKQKETLDTHD